MYPQSFDWLLVSTESHYFLSPTFNADVGKCVGPLNTPDPYCRPRFEDACTTTGDQGTITTHPSLPYKTHCKQNYQLPQRTNRQA
jgi:hypothetical protein